MSVRSFLLGCVATLVVLAAGAGLFVWSGAYDMGADRPHLPLTERLVATLRDRSTEGHARGIAVPDLDDPQRIAEGAHHYAEMCTGCHLAPGMDATELRTGLYPQPPNLAEDGIDNPAEAFWIVKHGLKMSAMPAWGKTHTDAQVWALVAFARRLPTLTPAQYRQLTTGTPSHAGGRATPHG